MRRHKDVAYESEITIVLLETGFYCTIQYDKYHAIGYNSSKKLLL